MDDQRRWEELDFDCLVNIFGRVGMESLLLDAPFVCKSWYKVTLDPSCWQSLVFPDLLDYDEGYYYPFLERFLNEYRLDWNSFSVTAFVKFVIDRSKGQATCLDLSPCASVDALQYAADQCPSLKVLAVSGYLLDHESSTILELIGKWKHLESLVLGSSYNFENYFSDSSKGKVTCLALSPCASEEELKYAADECPALKSLAASGYLFNHESSTILELIGNWNHLESLILGSSYNFENYFSDICFQCKNLRLLHVENADIGKDEAMAIVDCLPKLKELILRQANICRDDLVTLLRGCKELVRLDVSDCEGFDEGDEEISKLASHIENFSSKGSTIIDINDYNYYYEDSGSCNDQFGWGFNSD